MIAFQPVYSRKMGQQAPAPATPAAPAAPAVVTPPVITTTNYTGVPGFIETVLVLGVSAAAAWTGVRAGMNKGNKQVERAAGWVGGVGAALIGLLYLGSKTGVTSMTALPQIKVSPA